MAKNQRKIPAAAKAAARSTVSGPSKGPRGASGDPAARKMQGTQSLAAAFPFNASKPGEIGAAAKKPTREAVGSLARSRWPASVPSGFSPTEKVTSSPRESSRSAAEIQYVPEDSSTV